MDFSDIFKDVEPDMGVYATPDMNKQFGICRSDTDNYIHGIFQRRPLLGSEVIPDDISREIDDFTRECIDDKLKTGKNKRLSLGDAEKITLSLITHAKGCNFENGAIWGYILEQLGYDESVTSKIIPIFYNCMKKSMGQGGYKRFFLTTTETSYALTVMLHAFAPKRYWFTILNFLFKFYTKNLKHSLDLDDPILDSMVEGLYRRFEAEIESGSIGAKAKGDKKESGEGDDLQSGSSAHNFHTGVKYLICRRKKYGKALLVGMLFRIERLIKGEKLPGDDYEDRLCIEWYAARDEEVKKARSEMSAAEVVFTTKKIAATFVLDAANPVSIRLSIPKIRCSFEYRYNLRIYYGDKNVYDEPMEYYGDEDGLTLDGTYMALPTFESEQEFKRIWVVIENEKGCLYDSKESLYRDCMLFPLNGGREILPKDNAVDYGRYILVAPEGAPIGCDKATLEKFYGFGQGHITAYLADLSEGFVLAMGDEVVLSDRYRSSVSVLPGVYQDCPVTYRRDGVEYRIISAGVSLIAAKAGDDIDGCDIRVNGLKIDAEGLETRYDGDWKIKVLPVEKGSTLTFLDLKSKKRERYYAVEGLNVNFDREYYYSKEDYDNAICNFRFDGSTRCLSFSSDKKTIDVPYSGGEFCISIPNVEIAEDPASHILDDEETVYLYDIPQECRLIVNAPNKATVKYMADNEEFECVKNAKEAVISIGNNLRDCLANAGSGSYFDVRVEISAGGHSNAYHQKRIYFNEFFSSNPSVVADNENRLLRFEGADGFVGKDDTDFVVTLFQKNDNERHFNYSFSKAVTSVPFKEGMEDGEYSYVICIVSHSLFGDSVPRTETGFMGDVTIGDEKKYRYKNCVLTVSPNFNDTSLEGKKIFANKYAYKIRDIEYVGVELHGDTEFEMYRGTFYTETHSDGTRRDFSDKMGIDPNTGETKYKVNPVKISFLEGGNAFVLTAYEGPIRFDVTKKKKLDGYFAEASDAVKGSLCGPGESYVDALLFTITNIEKNRG